MSRTTLLNSSLLLGLEAVERAVQRGRKSSQDGYPPYNVELLPEEGAQALRVTLAVAGFRLEDLDVTLRDDELVIRGSQSDDRPRDYLHRGIAARQFQRVFALAPGAEVRKAELSNGLLIIELAKPNVEPVTRKVPIDARD
jgi:HSP20 family molecular chaperone IbpA